MSELLLWAASQNRALSVRPEHPSYLVPRHHVAEVHRLLQKSLVELVGRLPCQGEYMARGCVPGEARAGDGQLQAQREGRQTAGGRAAVLGPGARERLGSWCPTGTSMRGAALKQDSRGVTRFPLHPVLLDVSDGHTERLPPASSQVLASSRGRPSPPGGRAGGTGGSGPAPGRPAEGTRTTGDKCADGEWGALCPERGEPCAARGGSPVPRAWLQSWRTHLGKHEVVPRG